MCTRRFVQAEQVESSTSDADVASAPTPPPAAAESAPHLHVTTSVQNWSVGSLSPQQSGSDICLQSAQTLYPDYIRVCYIACCRVRCRIRRMTGMKESKIGAEVNC